MMKDAEQTASIHDRTARKTGSGSGSSRPLADTDLLDGPGRWIATNALVLAVLSGLAVITFGAGVFQHVLSFEDWGMTVERHFDDETVLSHGRWLHWLSIRMLGGDLVAPAVSLTAMLALWWVALLLVAREIGLKRLGQFLFAAVFTFHPILSDFISFETNHLPGGLSVLFCTLSGLMAWRLAAPGSAAGSSPLASGADIPRLVLPVLLLAVGSAGFQQFAVLMPMTFATLWACHLLRSGRATPAAMLRPAWIASVVGLGGVALYFLSVSVIFAAFSVEASGGNYDLFGALIEEEFQANALIRRFASAFLAYLFLPESWAPLSAKVLYLALLTAAGLGVLIGLLRRGYVLAGLFAGGMIVLLLVGPWLLGLFRVAGVYYPRALAPVALTWAGLVAIALVAWPRALPRSLIALAAMAVIALGMLNQNASIMVRAQQNARDAVTVAAMAQRIELMPGFRQAAANGPVTLFVIGDVPLVDGKHLVVPVDGTPAARGSCGLLSCAPGDLAAALRLYGTQDVIYRATPPPEISESKALLAQRTLDTMQPWPHADSIKMLETGEIIILLGRN